MDISDEEKAAIIEENTKRLELIMKELNVEESYIQEIMKEYDFPRDVAMMAILSGF